VLIFIPFTSLLGITILLGNLRPAWGLRRGFLRAVVLCGVYMVGVNEILSLINGITVVGLAVVWAIPACICLGWFAADKRHGRSWQLPAWTLPASWIDRLLLACIIGILILTAVVAWFAPVQTYDSLNYHMSRVAHWAQNHSLRPFATGIEKQNYMSPGAEIAVLQAYVLAQGDRFANFVEWFAMVVSLIGASLIAKQLGAGEVGQLLAAVFAATLPMGIAQASSTMTDYVVAMWLVCVAMESLALASRASDKFGLSSAIMAAGLAILTKPTAFTYLLPFGLLVAYHLIKQQGFRRSIIWALIAILLVVGLNAGYLTRNVALTGNPLGTSGKVAHHSNAILNWRVVVSNTLRNVSLHATTPFSKVNRWIYVQVLRVHVKLGVGLNDPRTSTNQNFNVLKPSLREDRAGNPLHALLILIFTAVTVVRARTVSRKALLYTLLSASTMVILSVMFKFTIFGSRYHLPFFLLFAPCMGYAIVRFLRPYPARLVGLLLVVASWSWLTGIDSRPLIPASDDVNSILVESRDKLYFAMVPGHDVLYKEMVELIQEAGCTDVGMMFSGGGAEYPLWAYMGAPSDQIRMEWIVSGPPSTKFRDYSFQPCALVCGSCPQEWEDFHGIPIVYNESGFRLFLDERQ
jgi:hypothetical protein